MRCRRGPARPVPHGCGSKHPKSTEDIVLKLLTRLPKKPTFVAFVFRAASHLTVLLTEKSSRQVFDDIWIQPASGDA